MKFWGNPSASSTATFFGQKAWFGCSPAPRAFLPAGYALPPFEGQFTFWWLSQYWFQKGIFLPRIRTFAVWKGGSLLALWQKTARGSSTIDIMRTAAGFRQGNGDPQPRPLQPRCTRPRRRQPRRGARKGPKKGSTLFSCCWKFHLPSYAGFLGPDAARGGGTSIPAPALSRGQQS